MTEQRALSPFEAGYFSAAAARFGSVPVAGLPVYIGSLVRGTVDAGLLRRVLDEVAAGHPLLRCRVAPGSAGAPAFHLREGFRPRLDVVEGGDEDGTAHLALINSPQHWADGFFRGYLTRDGERSRVVLAIHHGISDGRSVFALLDELWRRYTALASGAGLPVVVEHRVPDAIDTRLPTVVSDGEVTAFLDRLAEAAAGDGPVPAALPSEGDGTGEDPLGRFALDRLEYGPDTTAAFIATARAHGLTVNSLLCGAVLAAVRTQLAPAAGELPLVCGYAADLRGSLRPELPASTVLNCASGFGTLLPVAAGADPVALGRMMSADTRRALAERDPARYMLAVQRSRTGREAAALAAPPTVAVSNVGRVPGHPTPPGLRIVRDEVYTMAAGMPPKLTAFTYDGRLTVQVEYDTAVHTRALMGRLGAELDAVLREVAHRRIAVADALSA